MAEIFELICVCAASVDSDTYGTCTAFCCMHCKERKMCCFNERIYPVMTVRKAKVCRCINLCPMLAGFGTILSSCLAPFARPCDRLKMVLIGILYWLLVPFCCIGWCCAASHGKRLTRKAKEMERVITRVQGYAEDARKSDYKFQVRENADLLIEDLPLPYQKAIDRHFRMMDSGMIHSESKLLKDEREALEGYLSRKRR
mmetsp:Transcript_19435/g.23980  ORF Transcript_19435/g.23980 Transcript_19435/m.23980 type:complete len:200 (+) Transcript_19435:1-600(+)